MLVRIAEWWSCAGQASVSNRTMLAQSNRGSVARSCQRLTVVIRRFPAFGMGSMDSGMSEFVHTRRFAATFP